MIKRIKKFLGIGKKEKKTTDFSEFFYHAPASEKKKLLVEVVREANKDQQEVVKQYHRLFSKTI